MALFDGGSKEQKQKKKQAEKILDNLVGGLMPTRTRLAFFSRMTAKGIKPTQQEKVRLKVLKTIKGEVENGELEPTREDINQRIEQILDGESGMVGNGSSKLSKKVELEEKFGIDLTNRQWFKCSIEEEKYSTFTNQKRRNLDNAYVIINEDNFEIIKESVFLKSNMGTRKIHFYNIASIDYDASGMLHASSSVIVNTKSAEHVQLKFVDRQHFDLMNNAFESYLDKTPNPQQTSPMQATSSADELLKFAELYEKGLLTKEEFDLKKAELLGNKPVDVQQSGSTDEPVNKFCSNCGSELEVGSNFCPNCGNRINH